jgi:hypothetical protein
MTGAATPPTLRRLAERIRALAADNPRYRIDAALIAHAALTQAAIYAEAAQHRHAADGMPEIAAEFRRLAGEAESLARLEARESAA